MTANTADCRPPTADRDDKVVAPTADRDDKVVAPTADRDDEVAAAADELLDLWKRYNACRFNKFRRCRLASSLGVRFNQYHQLCPPGSFIPWLRFQRIPISTAYRLMKKYADNPPIWPDDLPPHTIPPKRLSLYQFGQDELFLHPNPKQRAAIAAARAKLGPAFDIWEHITLALVESLPDGPAHSRLRGAARFPAPFFTSGTFQPPQ